MGGSASADSIQYLLEQEDSILEEVLNYEAEVPETFLDSKTKQNCFTTRGNNKLQLLLW